MRGLDPGTVGAAPRGLLQSSATNVQHISPIRSTHHSRRTGLEVSKLSLGTWGFGNASAPEARIGDDDNLVAVLQATFDAGINFFDSAEAYANEERLGQLLKHVDVPDDLVVATKFGHGKGFSAEQFKRSTEQSLKDLGIEKIELMMIHDPRSQEDMDTILGKGGALEALRALQDQGLMGSLGVATGTITPLKLAVECGEFDVIQFPRLFTILNHAAMTSGLLDCGQGEEHGHARGRAVRGQHPRDGREGRGAARSTATGTRSPRWSRPSARCRPAPRSSVSRLPKQHCSTPSWSRRSTRWWSASPSRPSSSRTSPALSPEIPRADLDSIAAAGPIDEYYIGGPEFVWPFPDDRKPESLR